MAYNSDKSRGLYRKVARRKPKMPIKQKEKSVTQNPLQIYLTQFLSWSDMRGYTKATCITRRRGIERFLSWCAERELQNVTEHKHLT